MKHIRTSLAPALLLCAVLLSLLAPGAACAVPAAEHLRIDCSVLRLNINNEVTRHQIKLAVSVTRESEAELAGVEDAYVKIASPQGVVLRLQPTVTIHPRRFKAARAVLLFKAVEDSAEPAISNVPGDFFSSPGPYSVELWFEEQCYRGRLSFNNQIQMEALQEGSEIRNSTLRDEAALEISTVPVEFGPVYYKEQDLTNFVFQLANIEDALNGGSFHAPRENPVYVLQVRVSDGLGGPARLIDPSAYISGYEAHMIRSERTRTPISFSAEQFAAGEVAVIDFVRQEAFEANSVFSGPEGFSSDVVVRERIVFALGVESLPAPGELLELSSGESL